MPNNSIHLENGLWRRDQSDEKDPLRLFPELFAANASGRRLLEESSDGAPEFEVVETPECFTLSARIPGITPSQLRVRVTPSLVIVVRNERVAASKAGPRSLGSFPLASFRRAFVLPNAVDARRLKVAIEDDLLTIQLPKRTPIRWGTRGAW